jgi:hypothetical protein
MTIDAEYDEKLEISRSLKNDLSLKIAEKTYSFNRFESNNTIARPRNHDVTAFHQKLHLESARYRHPGGIKRMPGLVNKRYDAVCTHNPPDLYGFQFADFFPNRNVSFNSY